LAQAIVFVTLLSAVIQRARLVPDPEPFDEGLSDTAMGWILLLLTLLTAIFGFIISCVEVYGEPEMYVRHCWYRIEKKWHEYTTWLKLWHKIAERGKKKQKNVGALKSMKDRPTSGLADTSDRSSGLTQRPWASSPGKVAAKAKGFFKKARVEQQTSLRKDKLGDSSSALVRTPSTFTSV